MQHQNSINYKYYADNNDIVDDNNSIVLQVRVDAQGKAIVRRSPARASSSNQNIADGTGDHHRDTSFDNGMEDGEHEGRFDRNNIDTPAGLTKPVRKRVEVPNEFLTRSLQAGETVIGEYDYFYMDKQMYSSDIFLYGVYTCGIFFIFYGLYKLYRFLRNIFCCFCWKQSINNTRGKMVVTSNGRILFWQSSIHQSKAADLRAYFNVEHTIHAASIHDLKQMKIVFEHKNQGCYYCCTRFEACVELTFYAFNHNDSNHSKFLRTQSTNSYIETIKSFILGPVQGSVRQEVQPLVVGIVSDQFDKAGTPYEYENSQQHLEQMMSLCEALLSQLAVLRDSFMKTSAYLPITKANLHLAQMNDEEIKAYRNVGAAGVSDICPEIYGTKPLVDEQDEGRVNVPVKWLMLAPGEEIVSVVGQKYNLSWGEILLSICSFGILYLARFRKKSWQRSAIFITNKRLIEMTVNQHKGRIPVAFTGFRAVVRSYFVGESVTSGYIKGTSTQLISSLLTAAGQITAVLPRNQLAFAQRMQLAASRADGLRSYESVCAYLPAKFQFTSEEDLEGRGRGMLTDIDLALLPTLFEEDILNRFAGGIKYVPCCPAMPSAYLDSCCCDSRWAETRPARYCCHFEGPSKAWCLLCANVASCFRRPYRNGVDGVITTHSMYYLTYGPTVDEPFFVVWVSVKSLCGYSTSVTSSGAHPYKDFGWMCCHRQVVTKKGPSRYSMDIRSSEGFTLPFSYSIPYHNWLEDAHYTKMPAMMAAVDIRHDQVLASVSMAQTDDGRGV